MSTLLQELKRRKRLGAVLVVLVLGVVWLILDRGIGPEDGLIDETSIAVLPFTNLSNDPEQDAFAHGLSLELLDRLAEVPGLRVTAPASSFAFSGQGLENIESASRLRVAHVLEGTYTAAGNRIRIAVQLVEAVSGFRLWEGIFEEEASRIFEIQDQILSSVRDQLGARMKGAETDVIREKYPKLKAYNEYLRARFLLSSGSWIDNVIAVSQLEDSVALDPEFAHGHALLASAIFRLKDQPGALDLATSDEVLALALPHLQRALEIEADAPVALALRGRMLALKGNERGALGSYDHALAINPNMVEVLAWRAQLLVDKMARPRDAMPGLRRAVEIDPLSASARFDLARNLSRLGRYKEAFQVYQALSEMNGLLGSLGTANIYFQQGKLKKAVIETLGSMATGAGHQAQSRLLAGYLLALGLPEEAKKFDLVGDGWIEAYTGEAEAAVAKAWARVAENPAVSSWQANLLLVALVARDFELAALEAGILWEMAGAEVSYGGLFTLNRAAFAVRAYAAVGEKEAASAILEPALVELGRIRAGGVSSASSQLNFVLLLVAAGKTEKGLAMLNALVRTGFIENIIWNNPVFDAVQSDLRYQDSVQIAKANAARQRSTLLEAYCGDHPPSLNWTPENSSCGELAGLRR